MTKTGYPNVANDKIYFRGDVANGNNSDLYAYWEHNDMEINDVTRVLLDVTVSGTTAILYRQSIHQAETFDVVPAPTKPAVPAQPILSATAMTVQSGRPARFILKDVGSAVEIDDPVLGGITLGKLSKTYAVGWSDKIEVLITSGSNAGATWTGPSHLVSLAARKFTQANIGSRVTYTREDGAEILGELAKILGTTKQPTVEIISLDGQYGWVALESKVEFTQLPLGSKPKCLECNDTGVVDLFIGSSPCSICKP